MSDNRFNTEEMATGVALVGAIPWFAAIFIFVGNLGKWFEEGRWPDYKTAQMLSDMGLTFQQSNSLGLQKIIDLFMNTSAVWGLIIIGFFTAFLFGMIVQLMEKLREF